MSLYKFVIFRIYTVIRSCKAHVDLVSSRGDHLVLQFSKPLLLLSSLGSTICLAHQSEGNKERNLLISNFYSAFIKKMLYNYLDSIKFYLYTTNNRMYIDQSANKYLLNLYYKCQVSYIVAACIVMSKVGWFDLFPHETCSLETQRSNFCDW